MVDLQKTHELYPQLVAAGERHHITVEKVWQRLQGDWCIQFFQAVYPYPDGSGTYVTARHSDLAEMYADLIRYFTYVEEVDIMNIFGTNLFEYLAGEMFLDASGNPMTVKLTVKNVEMRKISNGRGGDEDKPVVSFDERPKLLVLNKSNARAIAAMYGGETNDWKGKKIALTAEHGAWFGNKGVRVVVLDHLPANGNGKKKPVAKTQPPPPETAEQMEWIDEPATEGAYAD